jgi:Hint domain
LSELQNSFTGVKRSRRNFLRATAILASAVTSAVMAKTTLAAADRFRREEDRDRDDNEDRERGRDLHCFLKGTMIRTADGERKIEDLAMGDLLPTRFGGMRSIQWIGRSRFKRSDPTKPWVRDVLPIRIARSALDPDVPHADLYVTQEHALLIDGVLVTAGSLVNSTTITRYEAREFEELEFFHIKLESHDVICAEGALCETLRNVDENASNFAEYLRQYGRPKTEETPCAPLLRYAGRRAQLRSCLRSAVSPWLDRRQQFDLIRDKLDARGIELLRQRELMS